MENINVWQTTTTCLYVQLVREKPEDKEAPSHPNTWNYYLNPAASGSCLAPWGALNLCVLWSFTSSHSGRWWEVITHFCFRAWVACYRLRRLVACCETDWRWGWVKPVCSEICSPVFVHMQLVCLLLQLALFGKSRSFSETNPIQHH